MSTLKKLADALGTTIDDLQGQETLVARESEQASDISPTIGERIRSLREANGLEREQLARAAEVSYDTILRYEEGKTTPKGDKLERLAIALGSSTAFIRTGQGQPLPKPTSTARAVPRHVSSGMIEVPFVPIKARATFAEFFDDTNRDDTMIMVPREEVEVPFLEATRCFEVNGDSMEPRLRSGWKVLGRQVPPEDWRYIGGGQVYVVLYRNTLVVKTIRDNNLPVEGFVRLHSENPSGGSVDVAQEDLRAIWLVYSVLPHRP